MLVSERLDCRGERIAVNEYAVKLTAPIGFL